MVASPGTAKIRLRRGHRAIVRKHPRSPAVLSRHPWTPVAPWSRVGNADRNTRVARPPRRVDECRSSTTPATEELRRDGGHQPQAARQLPGGLPPSASRWSPRSQASRSAAGSKSSACTSQRYSLPRIRSSEWRVSWPAGLARPSSRASRSRSATVARHAFSCAGGAMCRTRRNLVRTSGRVGRRRSSA